MVGKGGGEVVDIQHRMERFQLVKEEVEGHCLVGKQRMNARGDERLDRDGGGAVADDDGGVLGGALGTNRKNGRS